MAVIESKGDGYALFNGVKLPSLPEWDKETYPYALIIQCGPLSRKLLMVSSCPYAINANGALEATSDGYRCQHNRADSDAALWVLGSQIEVSAGVAMDAAWYAIWSNYDILNSSDSSVYLAASDPIPLDGMNVIEWDGDTEGLEVFPDYEDAFFITDVADVDVSRNTIGIRYGIISGARTINQKTMTQYDGYYRASPLVWYVDTASETYPQVGLYFISYGSAFRCELFAYYPIEEETEEMSTAKRRLLHEMFSKPVAHSLTGEWFPWG